MMQIIGHYRIIKLLGRGGMGEVYPAEDLTLKREVALKVLPLEFANSPIYLARFRRESESAAALHHSNICTIYEIGEADGRSYICMEYNRLLSSIMVRTIFRLRLMMDQAILYLKSTAQKHRSG